MEEVILNAKQHDVQVSISVELILMFFSKKYSFIAYMTF